MSVALSTPSTDGAWRESFRSVSLLATLLAGTCLTPMAALAQSTNNWIGTTPAYGTTTNWQNGATPLASETAVFSTLGTARSLAIATGTSVGGWQFSAGAPAYTFSVQNTYQFLTTGIVNSSSNAPVVTVTATGDLNFSNSTGAGNATIRNAIAGAKTTFKDSASAGTASLGNLVASTSLLFQDTASAASATITNTNGTVSFTGSASAGSASITSSGPTGLTSFSGSATAGSATITSGSGGKTSFTGSSTGGQARLIANPGAFVDISGLTTSGMTAGSIEGAGTYRLGSKQLTVGTNNIAGIVSGSIVDGGDSGGTGGSLVKTGTGTLILTGNTPAARRSAAAPCRSATPGRPARSRATSSTTVRSSSTVPTRRSSTT